MKLALLVVTFLAALTTYGQANCNRNYFTGNAAYSFAETATDYWVSTECKIARINKVSGEKTYYNPEHGTRECYSQDGFDQYSLLAIPGTNDLWAKRYKQLCRFTNNSWQVVDTNQVSRFAGVDKSNNIWFYSGDSLTRFDGARFTRISLPYTSPSGVWATVDTSGNVWIAVKGTGLLKYNGTGFQLYDASNSGLYSNQCSFVKFDPLLNALWIGNSIGSSRTGFDTVLISKFANNSWQHFRLPATGCARITATVFNNMADDTSGVYFTTSSNAVVRIRNSTASVYNECTAGINFPTYFVSRAMNGKLFIGTYGQGMALFDTASYAQEDLSNSHFMGTDNACLCVDSLNRLWIGSGNRNFGSTNGRTTQINYLDDTTWRFASIPAGIANYANQCASRSGKKIMFYQHLDQSVLTYDLLTNAWKRNRFNNASFLDVLSMTADDDNNTWFTVYGSSANQTTLIYKLDTANNFSARTNAAYGIGNAFFDLYLSNARNNSFWLATNDTISNYNFTTGRYTIYACPGQCFQSLRNIYTDRQNRVWIAGEYQEYMYDGAAWHSIDLHPNSSYSDEIRVICSDTAGNIYMGSNIGLYKFDGAQWTYYTEANSGIISNNITAMTCGKDNKLWLGTDRGLTLFKGCGGEVINATNAKLAVHTASGTLSLFSVFPNPANDRLSVSLSDPSEIPQEIMLTDMKGAMTINQTFKPGSTIDTKHIPAGVYFVTLKTNRQIRKDKLVIIH